MSFIVFFIAVSEVNHLSPLLTDLKNYETVATLIQDQGSLAVGLGLWDTCRWWWPVTLRLMRGSMLLVKNA